MTSGIIVEQCRSHHENLLTMGTPLEKIFFHVINISHLNSVYMSIGSLLKQNDSKRFIRSYRVMSMNSSLVSQSKKIFNHNSRMLIFYCWHYQFKVAIYRSSSLWCYSSLRNGEWCFVSVMHVYVTYIDWYKAT